VDDTGREHCELEHSPVRMLLTTQRCRRPWRGTASRRLVEPATVRLAQDRRLNFLHRIASRCLAPWQVAMGVRPSRAAKWSRLAEHGESSDGSHVHPALLPRHGLQRCRRTTRQGVQLPLLRVRLVRHRLNAAEIGLGASFVASCNTNTAVPVRAV